MNINLNKRHNLNANTQCSIQKSNNKLVNVNIVEKTGHSTADPRITNGEMVALDNLEKYLKEHKDLDK